MRKIINDPDNIVEEMMEGFIAAYHHMYYKHPEVNSVISRCRRKNKFYRISASECEDWCDACRNYRRRGRSNTSVQRGYCFDADDSRYGCD